MSHLERGTWTAVAVVQERFELPAALDSPRRARVLARDLVGEQLDGRRHNDLLILVTELVTNAVRHAGLGPEDTIVLHLAVADGVVRAEVCDPGRGFVPVVERAPGPDGGFGLVLLRTLPDRWGIAIGDATCVWFEIDAG
jgi:anti-sigma regulatory factor (Ser/Thr protein kinase)